MDEPSIWKKEISFRRKPKAPKPPPEPGNEPTSVWKKEISFTRKPKEQKPEPSTTDEPKQSIWKKDISLGKKRKDESAATPDEPKQSIWKKEISFGKKQTAESAPTSDEPKQSIWKKEISFGKKQKAESAAAAERPSAKRTGEGVRGNREVSPTGIEEPKKQSIWKKEIAFGKKKDAPAPEAVVEFEQVAEVVPAPVADVVPEPQPEPHAEPVVVAEDTPVFPEPEPTPVFRPHVSEETEQTVELPAPPTEVFPPAPIEPEPLPPAAQSVPPVSTPAPPTTPDYPPPAPVYPPAAVSPPAGISVPPVVPTAPEPQVVHPPVPASALPPEPSAEKSVPFWKREITLGGRSDKKERDESEPKPKRAKAPKVKVDRGGKGKKIIGLKIGASQLAAARVTNNGSAELLQVAREPLNPGVVVGGELRDPDALAVALKDFFTKHKLPKRGVRLGIANNRIGVRTFDIEGIEDQKQLDNAIRFRAQEALPIPIDEAVMDYHVLREATNEDGQIVRRILLVVAYREQIDRYTDACKKAGIGLVGIDLEAFALLRALQAPQAGVGDDPDAALVAVAIGHERSTFAVSDGRVCEFTRVLEWGGSSINVAIARALDAAPSEVEAVKRALSLMDEMTPDGLTPEQGAKAREAIRRAIESFARELVSSLQFYQNQPGSLGIGEIVLTGGTTHLPGLAAELEKLIGVRVRVGDPLARMKVSKKLGQPEQIGSLAVAIGLGIDD